MKKNIGSVMGKKGIDILDILIVLAKRKKFIIITTFLVTVAFIIYSLLATQYWKSYVSFLPITEERPGFAIGQDLLGGFGSALLGTEMVGASQRYINIIRSRTFSENIVRRFDLIEYFGIQDKDPLVEMEQAVKQLNEDVLQTSTDVETGMISLAIETRDRYLSADIGNAYFEMLEEYYLDSKMSKGRERRIFLEGRIREFEVNFAQLMDNLEQFQTEHNVIDMPAQTEAIISLYSELVAQKLENDIELEYARKYMAEDSHLVTSLYKKAETFNQKLQEMERSKEEAIVPRYIVDIDDIPSLTSRYQQLTLNVEIQRKVIEFLYPQFEQAKLDELRDISSFELIDAAQPAGLRSRPRRARMVIIAFVVSFLLSSLLCYTYESFTESSRKEKVKDFLKTLFQR